MSESTCEMVMKMFLVEVKEWVGPTQHEALQDLGGPHVDLAQPIP